VGSIIRTWRPRECKSRWLAAKLQNRSNEEASCIHHTCRMGLCPCCYDGRKAHESTPPHSSFHQLPSALQTSCLEELCRSTGATQCICSSHLYKRHTWHERYESTIVRTLREGRGGGVRLTEHVPIQRACMLRGERVRHPRRTRSWNQAHMPQSTK
jgi:hypothetical protein